MEKAGVPSVGIAARSFARAWQSCVDGWGQPATAFVTIPHACTGQQPDYIHKMVDEQIDNIILGLTRMSASADLSGGANGHSETDVFTVELDDTPLGLDAVNRFMEERDWSDGMPIVPPTPAAVEAMLKGTRRDPQDVVIVMEPGFGLATVEKIAINAVMAGCQPAQFPILLAALECIAQPEMNHRDMQVSGHTEAPLILVNGPIAAKAGDQLRHVGHGAGRGQQSQHRHRPRAAPLPESTSGTARPAPATPTSSACPPSSACASPRTRKSVPGSPTMWTRGSAPKKARSP